MWPSAGKEVAVYCADKMGDLIKSTGAYKEGDIGQALKDAFINCDRQLLLPEIAQELKKIANDGKEEDKWVQSTHTHRYTHTHSDTHIQVIHTYTLGAFQSYYVGIKVKLK